MNFINFINLKLNLINYTVSGFSHLFTRQSLTVGKRSARRRGWTISRSGSHTALSSSICAW